MKKLAFALLLLLTTATAFAFGAKKSTNPADFPIVVHVVFSHYSSDYQHLDAVIDGQEVELQRLGSGVLNPGDYKAQRITTYADLAEGTSSFIPKHSNPSDTFIVYRFLSRTTLFVNTSWSASAPKQTLQQPPPRIPNLRAII